MHHNIGNLAITASGVSDLATQENTGIRVHGGHVLRNRLVQLPQNDTLGVVKQVLADTRNVLDDGDAKLLKLLLGTKTREKHETGCVNCASTEDGLELGVQCPP